MAHEVDTNLARGLSDTEARRQARLKFGNPGSRAGTVELPIVAAGREPVARPALRVALASEDARIYDRRSACDRAWNRSEHGGVLGCECSVAQPAALSGLAVSHGGWFCLHRSARSMPQIFLSSIYGGSELAVLRDVAGYDAGGAGLNLTGGDHPMQVQEVHVTHDYFRLFGAPVIAGRIHDRGRQPPWRKCGGAQPRPMEAALRRR